MIIVIDNIKIIIMKIMEIMAILKNTSSYKNSYCTAPHNFVNKIQSPR